jgi:hypothetical protein
MPPPNPAATPSPREPPHAAPAFHNRALSEASWLCVLRRSFALRSRELPPPARANELVRATRAWNECLTSYSRSR